LVSNQKSIVDANMQSAVRQGKLRVTDVPAAEQELNDYFSKEIKRLEEKAYKTEYDDSIPLQAPDADTLKMVMSLYKAATEKRGYDVTFTDILHSHISNEIIDTKTLVLPTIPEIKESQEQEKSTDIVS
jgi:hypothetical protein